MRVNLFCFAYIQRELKRLSK